MTADLKALLREALPCLRYANMGAMMAEEDNAQLSNLIARIAAALEDKAGGWMPIETAPRDDLICIWISGKPVNGRRWCDGAGQYLTHCYYDTICGEWRTSRPAGRLICVPERYVTHWQPLPSPPSDNTKEK